MADTKKIALSLINKEGGLSKAKTDAASSNPVPDKSGFHTNKGITWTTYKNLAKELKYTPTVEMFYLMPDNIWYSIVNSYFSKVKAEQIKSQAVAELLAHTVFMSNANKAIIRTQTVLNNLGYKVGIDGDFGNETLKAVNDASLKDEPKLYASLQKAQLDYLKTLKSWKDNGKGWTNRLTSLGGEIGKKANEIIKKAGKGNILGIVLIFAVVITTILIINDR
jgi:lysozyme family protein